MENKCAYLDEFEILKTLGSGLHAKVKLGQLNGKLYAIKKFKKDTADLTTLEHQLGILKSLQHPNIIRLIDVRPQATYKKKKGTIETVLAIILEFAEGGQLFEYIAVCGRFSETIARTYFHMLIDSLEYLHSKGICHRDIKPQNILLDKDFRLRLADFGFSTQLAKGRLKTKLGTEGYMAPEIRAKNYDGKEVDLFAAGIILFVMFAGGPPFERAVPNDPYYKVLAAKNYGVFWGAHGKKKPAGFFNDNFKDLINKMLSLKPEERLTIEQIKQHPWYTGDVLLLNDIQEEFKQRFLTIQSKKGQTGGDSRSPFDTLLPERLKQLGSEFADQVKLLKQAKPDVKDLVLDMKPEQFFGRVKFLLDDEDNPTKHHILDEEVNESYEIKPVEEKPAVEIIISHNQLGENVESKIVAEVSANDKGNTVVKLLRDEDSCETMLYYKFSNYLKDAFNEFRPL